MVHGKKAVDTVFTALTGGIDQRVTGTIRYDTTITADTQSTQKQAYYYGSDSRIINLSFTCNTTPIRIKKARIAIFADSVTNKNSITPKSEFQFWFNTNGEPGEETQPTSLPKNTRGVISHLR